MLLSTFIINGNVLLDNNRFLQGETSNGIKINLIGLTGLDVQIGNTSATFNHVRFIRGTVTNMIVTSAGRVGIGTTNPSEKLHVNGNALADAHTTPSSRRWKTNIQTIENPLEKVKHLRGVTYDWKESGKHDIGLIAEEVGEVIPEIVAYEENGTDAKSVDYSRLVAVLIEAVKEQQKTIHELKKDHKQLATQIDRLEIQLSQASLGNK